MSLQEALSPDHPVGVVEVKEGEFAWGETQTRSTLRGINLRAGPGSLTMVRVGVGVL
jgi:tRNA A37 threonylcarbamoyladenosine modification protein TsaB